jgi:hypothetical protein
MCSSVGSGSAIEVMSFSRRSARSRYINGPGGRMNDVAGQVSDLLHEVGETHHQVFRITDGADDDWASWYADWLIRLSELPELLGAAPVRSELVYWLVKLDKDYTEESPEEKWEDYYAAGILAVLSSR